MCVLSMFLAAWVRSGQICASILNRNQIAPVALIASLACLLVPSTALAQSAPSVYVSTGATEQILQLNGDTGAIVGICGVPFVPEDVVIGPDNYLYIADTTGNKIWRTGTTLPAPASPATSCGALPVYDASLSSCSSGTSSTSCPTGPEGPSFLRVSTLDLYFNTHGTNTGVWKIDGIASAASNCGTGTLCPVSQVVPSFGSAASGEGTDFDIFGNLLAVDSADNQVLRAVAPGFSSAQPFITTNLSSPFGVALNTCGDVLVASGKYVNRYNSSSGAFIDRLSVGGNNYPRFLEVDAANRIFLTTSADETGKNATIWRFDPANAGTSNAITSCALAKYSLVWTQPLSTKTNLGLVSNNALGLGLGPSTFAISQTLSAANNFTALFNFGGQHTFSVTCTNPTGASFPMTVTALRSRPTDSTSPEVTFASPFPPTLTAQCPAIISSPGCVHYGSLHGFCTQYVETTVPADPSTVCGNFQFKVGFFSAEFLHDPGGAHSSGTNPGDTFTDCQSQDFYATAGPGLDSAIRESGSNSKHVAFNSDFAFQNTTLVLTSPVSSCLPAGSCNPQFNAGQNIAVKFNLSSANGQAVTNATEQLSVLRVQHTRNGVTTNETVPQTVVATKNSATLNFFTPNNSGLYAYNLDSSAFDPLPKGTTATYQFNIWGNGFQPYMFSVVVQF